MRRAGFWLVLLVWGAPAAFAAVGPCTETTEVVGTAGVMTTTSLSSRPARLCGVHFIVNNAGGGGFCQVFDSPDSTDVAHAQSRIIAEPGGTAAGDADHAWFGDNGYPTRFGLGVVAAGGRCIVHYGMAP